MVVRDSLPIYTWKSDREAFEIAGLKQWVGKPLQSLALKHFLVRRTFPGQGDCTETFLQKRKDFYVYSRVHVELETGGLIDFINASAIN